MSRHPLCFALPFLPWLLVCTATAQATHVVGPGGYADIGRALDVAAPGDDIVVQPGTYGGFWAYEGVTIRAASPGTVSIVGIVASFAIPPGQTAHVVGLDFTTLVVQITAGSVTFDTCSVFGIGDKLYARDAKVYFQRCSVRSNWLLPVGAPVGTFFAENCFVSAIDSDFVGGSVGKLGGFPSPGVRLQSSTLHASHCTFVGGSGVNRTGPGASAAIEAVGASTLWLSDSTLSSDLTVCPLDAPGAAGSQVRCILTPNCGGMPVAPLLGVTRPAPMTTGATFWLVFRTEPFTFVGVGSDWWVARTSSPLLQQDLLLGPAFQNAGAGLADALGSASFSWSIPAAPVLVGRSAWFQGVTGVAFPLQTSPVAGGVVQ